MLPCSMLVWITADSVKHQRDGQCHPADTYTLQPLQVHNPVSSKQGEGGLFTILRWCLGVESSISFNHFPAAQTRFQSLSVKVEKPKTEFQACCLLCSLRDATGPLSVNLRNENGNN